MMQQDLKVFFVAVQVGGAFPVLVEGQAPSVKEVLSQWHLNRFRAKLSGSSLFEMWADALPLLGYIRRVVKVTPLLKVNYNWFKVCQILSQ